MPFALRIFRYALLALLLVFVLPVVAHGTLWWLKERPASWREADWSSARILTPARDEEDASIRVFAARAGGMKGALAVHTWIVLKPAGASEWTRYEVVGWGAPVRRNAYPADARWYSNEPRIVHELIGPEAARLIPGLEAAIAAYPWSARGSYRIWPGPNSNTFVATVLSAVPELKASTPPEAVGRNFPTGRWIGRTAAGGFRATLGGFAGITLGLRDGVEIDMLGLVAGVRFADFAILLPGFGAVGPSLRMSS